MTFDMQTKNSDHNKQVKNSSNKWLKYVLGRCSQ